MTTPRSTTLPMRGLASDDDSSTAKDFYEHAEGKRVYTDAIIVRSLRKRYANFNLTIVDAWTADLLAFADAGHATVEFLEDDDDEEFATHVKKTYARPGKRMGAGKGQLGNRFEFAKFFYTWNDRQLIVYFVEGRDGPSGPPPFYTRNYYILSTEEHVVDELVKEIGFYFSQIHDQIWVYDQGWWQKSSELFRSMVESSWDQVIMDDDMKSSIVDDVDSFMSSEATYKKFKIPWKRGLIFHGPPGNGKTISIKALMHSLYKRKDSVLTLYVRTLANFRGPEASLSDIFEKAREQAPCILVFEDLDSIVSEEVKSYFFNQVDGLSSNNGILMVGSTNYLNRLDPGISKRPSRFDRKYYFPEPNYDERVAYCEFWREKLSGNDELEFPQKLCPAIAKITDEFSFAYLQEAFVASLLAIASGSAVPKSKRDFSSAGWRKPGGQLPVEAVVVVNDEDPDLKDLVLWKEMKKQIKILRDQIDDKRDSGTWTEVEV